MTDTEAKALALLNQVAGDEVFRWWDGWRACNTETESLCRAIEQLDATEARHAAEMWELKERFSEVAKEAYESLDGYSDFSPAGHARKILAPFIIAAPDPLVEIAREMTLLDGVFRTDNQKAAIREGRAGSTTSEDFYDRLRAAMQARGYQVTKIGEVGE